MSRFAGAKPLDVSSAMADARTVVSLHHWGRRTRFTLQTGSRFLIPDSFPVPGALQGFSNLSSVCTANHGNGVDFLSLLILPRPRRELQEVRGLVRASKEPEAGISQYNRGITEPLSLQYIQESGKEVNEVHNVLAALRAERETKVGKASRICRVVKGTLFLHNLPKSGEELKEEVQDFVKSVRERGAKFPNDIVDSTKSNAKALTKTGKVLEPFAVTSTERSVSRKDGVLKGNHVVDSKLPNVKERDPEAESAEKSEKVVIDSALAVGSNGILQSLQETETRKVIEVWRKGKGKRYLELGIEFLYGRTKPTRLYGPLNSRGEVPGSGLAPVPRRYRDRCDHQNGWSVKEVVAKVLEVNHWDDIDRILNHWVGRYNRKNFPPLMLVISRTGALKHSERVFNWMKNQRCYRARSDIYNLMIWLYARHSRVDKARALYWEMQEWRCNPDLQTYNALINVHGRARQWRESRYFFDRMLRAAVPPSTGTYNNLINACGSSGKWEQALEVYKQMQDNGVEMDVVTHNTILTALKIGEQYAMAIEHFERMLRWRVLPSRITLNIIISCFSKMERYDEAVQLFNSMKSMKWAGCKPDLVTFTTLMHVYASCGQVANVKAVFDMILEDGVVPNIVTYNTLIGSYASFGMDLEARETFELLRKVGFEPDVVSYTALINAYSKSGKTLEAVEVFDFMKRRSRKPNIVTYNTLIDAYSSAGQVREALRVLPNMDLDNIPPNVVTICSLIVACGRSGETERVKAVLNIADLRKITLNVNVYNTAMSVYLNVGMYGEASKLYQGLDEKGIKPDAITFSILINGAAKVGSISEAQRRFDEMLALNIGMSVEACSALIHGYAEQGRPGDAHAVLIKMKESGCAPNLMTYTSLIHAYSVADMPDGAVAVFEEMETMAVELDAVACSALFPVLNQCDQSQKTLLLWSKLRERVHFTEDAYAELLRACCMLRDWRTPVELFKEMQQVGARPTLKVGNNLLRSLCKSGAVQQLIPVFTELKELGMAPTADTLNIMVEGYSRVEDWRQCLEILGSFKLQSLEPDLDTYKMVLKCLEKAELWDRYLEVYDQMISDRWSTDFLIFKVVLKALRYTGQKREAFKFQSTVEALREEEDGIVRKAVELIL